MGPRFLGEATEGHGGGGHLTNKEYFDELVSIASAVRTTGGALCTCSIDFSGYF